MNNKSRFTGSVLALFVAILALAIPVAGNAQDTSSAIGGVITDSNGNPLVGAVVTVSNEIGQARYPSSRRMMVARRTPPTQLTASELLPGDESATLAVSELFLPELQGRCEMIEGDSAEQQARELLRRLNGEGVLGG